ncbi:hypothetical protein DFH06DRAFT_100081 [Mycena polygramma]|nr:hypothetical protein DFH06DRAFT_100081 [Mycena polygramma]
MQRYKSIDNYHSTPHSSLQPFLSDISAFPTMLTQLIIFIMVATTGVLATPLRRDDNISFCPGINVAGLDRSGGTPIPNSDCRYGPTICKYDPVTGFFNGSNDGTDKCPLRVSLGTGITEGINGCPTMNNATVHAPFLRSQTDGVVTIACFYLNQEGPCFYQTPGNTTQGGPDTCLDNPSSASLLQ